MLGKDSKGKDVSWQGIRDSNMEEKYLSAILKNNQDLTQGNGLGMICMCKDMNIGKYRKYMQTNKRFI